mgnify:CR=1 FL=1
MIGTARPLTWWWLVACAALVAGALWVGDAPLTILGGTALLYAALRRRAVRFHWRVILLTVLYACYRAYRHP